MEKKICKWYNLCPIVHFVEEGKLDKKWIENYCWKGGKDCKRYEMEEKGISHLPFCHSRKFRSAVEKFIGKPFQLCSVIPDLIGKPFNGDSIRLNALRLAQLMFNFDFCFCHSRARGNPIINVKNINGKLR